MRNLLLFITVFLFSTQFSIAQKFNCEYTLVSDADGLTHHNNAECIEIQVEYFKIDEEKLKKLKPLTNLKRICFSFALDPGNTQQVKEDYIATIKTILPKFECILASPNLQGIKLMIGEQLFLSDEEKKKCNADDYDCLHKMNEKNFWIKFGNEYKANHPKLQLEFQDWGW